MTTIRTVLFLVAIFFLRNGEAQTPTDSTYNSTASLKRGCYASVQEFLTNDPSIVDSFYVVEYSRKHPTWEGNLNCVPRMSDRKNKKKLRNIWGYCDGKTAYVFHQGEYFVLISESSGHYFVGFNFIDYNYNVPTNAKVATAMGHHDVALRIIQEKAKSEKTEYKIDPHTGWALHPDPIYNSGKPVETLIFYRSAKKELVNDFTILLNDTLELNFIPNSYHSLTLLARTPEVKICQGEGFSDCNTYTLNLEGFDYFKLSIPEESGVPAINQVSESEGEYYSFKAQQAQKKRNKKRN